MYLLDGDFFAAGLYNVVLKFEFNQEEGTWTNVTIVAGTGEKAKGDDGILGTASALNTPMGLSLIENANGDPADNANHRVRKLDMSTRMITTIAGNGVSGDVGDGGLAKDAQLKLPRHVYYDKSNDDIYILDTGNKRIRRVRDGTITTVVGKPCSFGGALGDGGQATGACFSFPIHFMMNNAGEWFVVDFSDNRIRKVYLNGTITTVAGGGTITGDAPATSVKLNNPMSIAFLPSDEMLIADHGGASVIRKMDNSGFMKIIAGGGSEALSSTDPIPAKNVSTSPLAFAIARDGSDAIFVCDNSGYFSSYLTKQSVMVFGPTIQPFALATVPVLVLMSASVTMGGCKSIARSLTALVSHPTCQIESVQARASA